MADAVRTILPPLDDPSDARALVAAHPGVAREDDHHLDDLSWIFPVPEVSGRLDAIHVFEPERSLEHVNAEPPPYSGGHVRQVEDGLELHRRDAAGAAS